MILYYFIYSVSKMDTNDMIKNEKLKVIIDTPDKTDDIGKELEISFDQIEEMFFEDTEIISEVIFLS